MDSLEAHVAETAAKMPKTAKKRDATGKFVPGTAPGPGRPLGSVSLVTLLRSYLADVPPGEERRTRALMLVEKTWQDAMKGDGAARKLVWEYLEGGPQQHVELSGGLSVEHLTEDDLDRELRSILADPELGGILAREEAAPVRPAGGEEKAGGS